ncbi:uncharacterized protein LOC128552296 [Mercenaria mercenaria]|uniref:uncharacterized protein LOC128552296 n=1 Tax=Mercenaria mercenaria TaxID=6596 RepID=UPI00234E8734|nr:uncharacterized protein LOC128552296 [Mercenaria mercenaria]XP_053389305.1 uncharacterized protein LOC128552296 [Mercenaria mercenaria]
MQSTELQKKEVDILRPVWIIGIGIFSILLFKNRRLILKHIMHFLQKLGIATDQSAVLDVFWYDTENFDINVNFHKEVQKKLKSHMYNFIKVTGTEERIEGKCINECSSIPIIAVCRRSTYRLKSIIDACLQGLEEKDYVRTLLIFLHPKGSEDLLMVSTKQKVELSHEYSGLKIVDIIFGKGIFYGYNIKSCHGHDFWKEMKEFLGHWSGKKESA